MSRAFIPPETCPVCGEAVPRTAKACPGCGADERSGWDEETALYDGLDLPASAFEKVRSPPSMPVGRSLAPWLIATAVLLIAVLLFLTLR
ncbi:MAG: zinc ribbon domain-containing protein [Candidatus Didemnitutus sp.]|nr:zinc ribbon domain-containing protein [Candidatus Didemnitutus sp.]